MLSPLGLHVARGKVDFSRVFGNQNIVTPESGFKKD